MRIALIAPFILIATGCASMNSLPQSADQVDFDSGIEGKTGWSAYEEITTFPGVAMRDAFDAAKAGLGDAGFALRKADYEKRMVLGAHGMTAHDWNVVAGVYLRSVTEGVQAKVHVEGSKDIGFSGDATSGAWTGQILKGMRKYILDLEARRPGTGVTGVAPN